jgi:hypothetical protein
MATTPKPVKVKPTDTSTGSAPSSPSSKQPSAEPAPVTSTPVTPANIKPAHDTPPKDFNTMGKITPQTAPAPKKRTKAERDQDIAKYDQERKAALQRGDKAAAEAADLKAAQVMDEPKGLGDVAGEVWGIGSIFMGGGRGRGVKNPPAKPAPATPAAAPKPATAPAAPASPKAAQPAATTAAPAAPAQGKPGGYVKGTKRRPKDKCELMPYKDMICDGEKHHVVPHWTTRTGSAKTKLDPSKQIPGTPAYEDAPAICLSKEEHKGIHKTVDEKIQTAGKGGTVSAGKVKEISAEEAAKKSGCNPKNIKKQLKNKFKTPDDATLRGVKDARKMTPELIDKVKNGTGGKQ